MHHRRWRASLAARHGLADVDGDVSWRARGHPRWALVREWRRDGSSPPPWGPNYAPDAHTVRNDYGACFVDSGLVTPPSAWVPTSDACAAEHPKRRRLLDLKAALVQASAIPRTYLQADVRTWLDPHASLGVLEAVGYDVILIDPPLFSYAWRAPHESRHACWTWDEVAQLPIPRLASRESFVFLWVGDGRDDGLERGRDCLQRWGFRRCEDIVWVQTESCTQYAPASPSLLKPVVQHCLMGIRGTVVRSTDSFFVHCNIDTDVILWPGERPAPGMPISPERKPPDLYEIVEHFCLGTRRLELFGTNRNLRDGWLTVGWDVGPQAPSWPAHGALPLDPAAYAAQFVLDPPHCPLYARSNLVPYSDECEQLRPRTPPPEDQRGQPRPAFRAQPPRHQLLNQGAGGRSTVSTPSASEHLSGAQAQIWRRYQR